MKRKHSLLIKTSQIPNSGKGLYTKSNIRKGEIIGEYKGRRITNKIHQKLANEDKDGYVYGDGNFLIDAMHSVRCPMRYMNDAAGITRVKGLKNNAEFKFHKDVQKVFVYATHDIKAGQEIFVDYTKSYWDVVRQNIKIEQYNIKHNLI